MCVLEKCIARMPNERFIYLADSANMPYGVKTAAEIKRAATDCVRELAAMNCKAVLVACNTATAVAIDDVRRMYPSMTVVGLEPAVKPCLRELGRNGYAVALVTSATYGSDKFKRLTAACGGRIIGSEQPLLAGFIEDNAGDFDALRPFVFDMLSKYGDAEAIVLGCSHYSHVSGLIREFYGGNIKIYDGADGAVNRLAYCLSAADIRAPENQIGSVRFYSTYKSA